MTAEFNQLYEHAEQVCNSFPCHIDNALDDVEGMVYYYDFATVTTAENGEEDIDTFIQIISVTDEQGVHGVQVSAQLATLVLRDDPALVLRDADGRETILPLEEGFQLHAAPMLSYIKVTITELGLLNSLLECLSQAAAVMPSSEQAEDAFVTDTDMPDADMA